MEFHQEISIHFNSAFKATTLPWLRSTAGTQKGRFFGSPLIPIRNIQLHSKTQSNDNNRTGNNFKVKLLSCAK